MLRFFSADLSALSGWMEGHQCSAVVRSLQILGSQVQSCPQDNPALSRLCADSYHLLKQRKLNPLSVISSYFLDPACSFVSGPNI